MNQILQSGEVSGNRVLTITIGIAGELETHVDGVSLFTLVTGQEGNIISKVLQVVTIIGDRLGRAADSTIGAGNLEVDNIMKDTSSLIGDIELVLPQMKNFEVRRKNWKYKIYQLFCLTAEWCYMTLRWLVYSSSEGSSMSVFT